MYLNLIEGLPISKPEEVEPKHKMYLNSDIILKPWLFYIVEPKHKIYLNPNFRLAFLA